MPCYFASLNTFAILDGEKTMIGWGITYIVLWDLKIISLSLLFLFWGYIEINLLMTYFFPCFLLRKLSLAVCLALLTRYYFHLFLWWTAMLACLRNYGECLRHFPISIGKYLFKLLTPVNSSALTSKHLMFSNFSSHFF